MNKLHLIAGWPKENKDKQPNQTTIKQNIIHYQKVYLFSDNKDDLPLANQQI